MDEYHVIGVIQGDVLRGGGQEGQCPTMDKTKISSIISKGNFLCIFKYSLEGGKSTTGTLHIF